MLLWCTLSLLVHILHFAAIVSPLRLFAGDSVTLVVDVLDPDVPAVAAIVLLLRSSSVQMCDSLTTDHL